MPKKRSLFFKLTVPVQRRVSWALALVIGMILLPDAFAQSGNGETGQRSPKYTEQGPEACGRCHSGDIIQVITKTAHGKKDNPHAPYAQHGCESCHGPGSFHVSRAHGGVGFPGMVAFGAGKPTPMERQIEACLDCHAKAMGKLAGMNWQNSAHDRAKLTCSVCHKVHSTDKPMASRDKQAETCFMCHPQQKTEHRRFENKGIVFDELSCWDCHDVHQLTRNANAATGSQ